MAAVRPHMQRREGRSGGRRLLRLCAVLGAALWCAPSSLAGDDDRRDGPAPSPASDAAPTPKLPVCGGPILPGNPLPRRCVAPERPSTSLIRPLEQFTCRFALVIDAQGVPLRAESTGCIPAVMADIEVIGLMWRFHPAEPDEGGALRRFPMAFRFGPDSRPLPFVDPAAWDRWMDAHREDASLGGGEGCRIDLELSVDGTLQAVVSPDLVRCGVVPAPGGIPPRDARKVAEAGCVARFDVGEGRAGPVTWTGCEKPPSPEVVDVLRRWTWASTFTIVNPYQVRFVVAGTPPR
ncbi:hypothetical protein L6R53_27750 [Myxococcota bacterium]|nr:hypothetical protein [Myxococcota bacterium]